MVRFGGFRNRNFEQSGISPRKAPASTKATTGVSRGIRGQKARRAAKAKGNQADLGDPRAEARARHGQADLAEGRCSPEAVHGVDRGRSRPAEHFRDGAGGVAGRDTEWRPAEKCWR